MTLRSNGSNSVIYGAADEAALFPKGYPGVSNLGVAGQTLRVVLFKY